MLTKEKYWGTTPDELVSSLNDLNRWATANEESAIAFDRMGAPVEAAMMRNAARDQRAEYARVLARLEGRAE
jgi:hypothetical protein